LKTIQAHDNYFLKTLSGPLPSQHLTKIHSLIIQGNKENLSQNSPRLNRLSGFSSIIEISEQLVLSSINANNSELSLGIGKNLKTVNNIFILDNNEITNLDWLNQLSHIEGELYIKFNKSLNKCDLNLIPIYQPHHSKNISNNGKQCNTLGKQTPQRT